MKADEPRQNRIPFMVSDAELKAIDDWRFKNRIGTRADAIRRLCQIGLASQRDGIVLQKHSLRALKAILLTLDKIGKADLDKLGPKGLRGGLAAALGEQIAANKAALSTLVAASVFEDGLDHSELGDLISRAEGYVEALVNREHNK